MNWFKNVFKSKQKSFYPAPKEVFISTYSAYFETMEMTRKTVETSQSGNFIEIDGKPVFLREKGELYPEPYDGGKQDRKAEWFPKSGWSLDELKNLDMITEKDYKFNNL